MIRVFKNNKIFKEFEDKSMSNSINVLINGYNN